MNHTWMHRTWMHQPYIDPFWWQMNQREKSGFYELDICLWFYDLLFSYEWRKPRKHLGFLPRNLFKIIFSILAVKLQFPGISNVWIFIATTWQTYHSARFRWILILVRKKLFSTLSQTWFTLFTIFAWFTWCIRFKGARKKRKNGY